MPIREGGHEPETVIASSVKVEGDFSSEGNVLIEGVVEGSLRTARDLRVGERAKINADVAATNAVIAGEVHGNIVISERLELEPTAHLFGDVRTKTFVVASGASVNGRITMGEGLEEKPVRGKKAEVPVEAAKAVKAVKEPADEKVTANPFFGA